jgi:hypothetical protein
MHMRASKLRFTWVSVTNERKRGIISHVSPQKSSSFSSFFRFISPLALYAKNIDFRRDQQSHPEPYLR